jgi:uncharacterized protein GlcG (DUF336 family)
MSITYEDARALVSAGLEFAHSQGLPPMTIAVLDPSGQLVSFGREDGSTLFREPIARAKAMGALGMRMGSRSIATLAQSNPQFVQALTAITGGQVLPVPGGVLIRNAAGEVIGSVGVSGAPADQDERCAVEGIAAVRLVADPGS